MVNINGVSYKGSSVSISNGVISIDGKKVNTSDKVISIVVEGNLGKLVVDDCNRIEVKGSCGSAETMSGDVNCGDISGNVETMSGDIYANNVSGKAETMSGDITTITQEEAKKL